MVVWIFAALEIWLSSGLKILYEDYTVKVLMIWMSFLCEEKPIRAIYNELEAFRLQSGLR